jgi:hypothetical protein
VLATVSSQPDTTASVIVVPAAIRLFTEAAAAEVCVRHPDFFIACVGDCQQPARHHCQRRSGSCSDKVVHRSGSGNEAGMVVGYTLSFISCVGNCKQPARHHCKRHSGSCSDEAAAAAAAPVEAGRQAGRQAVLHLVHNVSSHTVHYTMHKRQQHTV